MGYGEWQTKSVPRGRCQEEMERLGSDPDIEVDPDCLLDPENADRCIVRYRINYPDVSDINNEE